MMNIRPQCVGVIMDGNRRWAREKHLPISEGHKKGQEVLFDFIRFLRDENIANGVFYAFSTENWSREEKEVSHLLKLFEDTVAKLDELLESEEPVKINFIGQRYKFPKNLQKEMGRIEKVSVDRARTTVWIALSYGGRAEIVEAVNKAVKKGKSVTEESFQKLLWTEELPDPDIIVRTSGEKRLSNFLTWGSAYSELYFIEKNWPALTTEDFEDILTEYGRRERRKGK